jgi:hypothetical protein
MTIVAENTTVEAAARVGLTEFLCQSLAVLWKDWPMDMKVVTSLRHDRTLDFVLDGTCPHCHSKAVFQRVTEVYSEPSEDTDFHKYPSRHCAAMQCPGCRNYILAVLKRNPDSNYFNYEAHYPLGKPNDNLSTDIPVPVRPEFQEAIRCRWIHSLKATVLMCRRSLQVSCDREGARGNDLFTQIDDLASRQRITETLRKMAHRIRLLGKRGAHGDFSDIDDTITETDADDAITFMSHYLEHVYVLPAKLDRSAAAP